MHLSYPHEHLHLVPLGVLLLATGERLLLGARHQQRPVPGRAALQDPVAVDKVDNVPRDLDFRRGDPHVRQLEELPLKLDDPGNKKQIAIKKAHVQKSF